MSNKVRSQQRKKNARSIASEDPWRVETPFGPPRISHLHFPEGGIRRIRNTLHKLSPSARAERELLRQKNRYKIPLTERNVDTFVTEQQFTEACYPEKHSNELHVSAWLERLASCWQQAYCTNWTSTHKSLSINGCLRVRDWECLGAFLSEVSHLHNNKPGWSGKLVYSTLEIVFNLFINSYTV
ncbi:hypothetical protein BDV30DRAFT_228192 [Aspergillus minisclerotigenes]|uniref:Uncharacterized protein n=1 Tax=Aspergillus minisclerotigenes TaxID=656917 RepID=A0A5N6IYD6_9EURO|nr:hypothetical protein BDV30DRAFT_228192 [Aspergillus minisclerotigenes]